MNQITSKLGISRLCLMFFILLYSVFMCENAFSQKYWQKENMKVFYNEKERTITIKFLFYDYKDGDCITQCHMDHCYLSYTPDGNKSFDLIKAGTKSQGLKDVIWMNIDYQKGGGKIEFPNSYVPENPQPGKKEIGVQTTDRERYDSGYPCISKSAYMNIKWQLPESFKHIEYVKIKGVWVWNQKGRSKNHSFMELYTPVNIVNSNSYLMINNPSALESAISKNVKVSKVPDAITVTGAVPGENIKIYTTSGIEVKSVVATDKVVNIRLAKNRIYIVKTGQTSDKVAL